MKRFIFSILLFILVIPLQLQAQKEENHVWIHYEDSGLVVDSFQGEIPANLTALQRTLQKPTSYSQQLVDSLAHDVALQAIEEKENQDKKNKRWLWLMGTGALIGLALGNWRLILEYFARWGLSGGIITLAIGVNERIIEELQKANEALKKKLNPQSGPGR